MTFLQSKCKAYGYRIISLSALCLFLFGCHTTKTNSSAKNASSGKPRYDSTNNSSEWSMRKNENPFLQAYDEKFMANVKQQWFALLDDMKPPYDPLKDSGTALLQFRIHSDGTLSDLKIVRRTVREELAATCVSAVNKSFPMAPWEERMRRFIGKDFRDIEFSFNFDDQPKTIGSLFHEVRDR